MLTGQHVAAGVREFKSEQQFEKILSTAKPDQLIVVDFYRWPQLRPPTAAGLPPALSSLWPAPRTACGSCKYIGAGFLKLCKGSHEEHAPVEFLKHNVYNEYEEPSPVSERLRVKVVPSFFFYK